jgi:hypothetical protein
MRHNAPAYEVLNAGVVGFLSGQELAYIITDLVDLEPHLIVAFNGWNDVHEPWENAQWMGRYKRKAEMGYNNNFYHFQIEKRLHDYYKVRNFFWYALKECYETLQRKSFLLTGFHNLVSRF